MSDHDEAARERGQRAYSEYFGKPRPMEGADPLDEMTVDHLFANVWSRKAVLDMKVRSLITVALLASQGRDEELQRHLAGANKQGVKAVEIEEVMVHVAHYAGWASGHHGMKVAKPILACFAE